MRSMTRSATKVAGILVAAACLIQPAIAQDESARDYPTKPVRLIIPFPPGGSNDVVGRIIAQHLGDRLGKQVVVDNRGGAGGTIGTEAVSKAMRDGYTLGIISIAHAVNPWLYQLPYDSLKSFAPVAILASGPNVLVVNPDFPPRTVKDLIALAKAQPGRLQYASAGIGSFEHLGAELFKLDAGVDMVHVPYKGGGPAMTDVMGGQVKIIFASLVQTTGFIASGQLRPLGTGGLKRSPALPDVPTIAEAGVPGYEGVNWWGVVAPAGTPPAIVAKLHAAIADVQNSADVKKQFAQQGADLVQMSSADFGAFIARETDKWEKVVKAGNIKAE
jgi:tripartite-type tricarboxylate transporter receptor subunit TctC